MVMNQLESFVARGRHSRNVKEQREISFGLAELSTTDDLHERLVKKGGVETLVYLLGTCQDSESQQFAALAMANTASTISLCKEIAELDGVLQCLVAFVDNENSDSIGKQYCAMAIGNLLAEPDNHKSLVELGCISSLITMLQNCSDGRELESGAYAAFAISNIASDCSYHQQIVQEGAIELLVALACCDDEAAQRHALLSLRGLCGTKDNRHKVLQKGILDPLILLSRSRDKDIVREVSCVLNCLSSEDEIKEEISYRTMSTLISLLVSGDDYVERHSCCAIANLLVNSDIHLRFIEERGLPPLVSLCSSTDGGCRQEAMRALSNLSFNRELNDSLVEENALCPFVNAIDNDKCRFATLMIANIATHAQVMLAIVQAGAIRPLISLISASDNDVEARRFGALALTNITTCEAFHSIVIGAGVLEALFALSNTSDLESKQFVGKTFANLSCNMANHEMIAERGGFQPIITLANESDPDIHRHAVAALWGLSTSCKLKANIIDEGGLGPLCRLLPLSVKDQQLLHDITACLCNLSQEDENKFEMARSGLVSTLSSCMESENSTIACYACECIANLSEAMENQGFLARIVIKPCAGAMQSRHATIQRESGRLSANLSGSSDQIAANIIIDDGIHLLLMSFLLSKDSYCQRIGSVGIGNLCTFDCHRAALMNAGVLEPLVSLVRSEKSNIESRRFSMLAIANLAASFANHDGFVSHGTIPMLISFSNSHDAYLKDYAAFALAELSRNIKMTEMLASEGALAPVLALLNSKSCDKCVERQLLPAVRTLSFLDRNKVDICASKSLGVILGFVSDCNSSVDELQLACCTAANLVELEYNMELAVNSGCIPTLIGALQSDSEVVQSESARALGNLACNIDCCELILGHEVTQLLVACYRDKSNESRRMAAMALSNLSSNMNSHAQLAELNVMDLVTSECLTALDLKQSSDHETLRYSLLIIANLTGGNQNQSLTESLFDILMHFTRHRDVKCREHAVLALGNLCTNPVHVKRLVDVKCSDALVAYSFPTVAEDSANAQFQAIAGLHGLSKHAALREPLLREGGLEPLILGARGDKDSSHIEIQRESAAALNNMAMAKGNRRLMAKSGALSVLKNLLKKNDNICRNHASSALANLAETNSEGIHNLLLGDRCLEIMCKHVNDKDSHVDTKRAISRCIALFASNPEVHEHLLSSDVLKSLNFLISATKDRYCERYGILAVANLAIVELNHPVVLSTIRFETTLSLAQSKDVETLRGLSFATHSFSKCKRNHALLEEANAADSLVALLRSDDYDTSFQACLATKYLCTSENWRNIIAESNGLEILFSLTSKYDLELKRELAATFRNMSLSHDNKRRMMNKDGMKKIAKLCRDSDSTVSYLACGALANIAERPENKVDLVKQGIIHHFQFAALAKCIPVVRESIRAFANLSSANENVSDILTSGALTLIVDSLLCEDTLCQRYAAIAMSNLALTEESRHQIVQEGVVTTLVSLVRQTNRNNIDKLTQQHAMSCLANIASCHSLQNGLILSGCTTVSIDHIKSTNLDLRISALLYVANLASNVTSQATLEEWCITKDLINCLQCNNRLVQMHALSALRGLSTSSSIRDEIISCGGLESLLAFVNCDDVELKQEVLLTLCNLSMSGTISDRADTFMHEVDMQNLIGFLCNETFTSHRVFGAMTIGNIASNLDFHPPILESGALENLIGLSESNDSDVESQRCMALAICNLAVQPANRFSIISNGGLSSIMYLCHTQNPDDTFFGLSTLRALLVTSYDSRRVVFEEGILHALSLGMQTDCLGCKREIATILALLSLSDENKLDLARSDEIKDFICLLEVDDVHCISLMCRCIGSICEIKELHQNILNVFPLKQLLPRLMSDANPNVAKEVTRCYANLSSNLDIHKDVVTPAIVNNLNVLCSSSDSDVRRLSSLSISNLSANETIMILKGKGVLTALHSVIDYKPIDGCNLVEDDANQQSIESKCYACMAMGSLISTDYSVAKQIVVMGIIPPLLHLVSVENEQLNLCAVYLIDKLSLAEDTHQDLLYTHRTISHLMNQKHQTKFPHVLTYTIEAIGRLFANKNSNSEYLMMSKTIPFLAESSDFDNKERCRQIVSGLCHLVLRSEARAEIANSDMINCLQDLSMLSDIDTSRFALGCFANIAEDYRFCRVIEGLPNIVTLLLHLSYGDDISVVREATRVFANLLSSTEFQVVFLKEEGMSSLLRVSQFHDYECIRNAALALRKLAANEVSHGNLFSQGGIEAIIHLAGQSELEVRIQSAAALRDIASNDHFTVALKDRGVVGIAIELASTPEFELKVFALGILRHLSLAMNLKTQLMDKAILDILSDCIESSVNEELLFECTSFVANLAEHAQNKVALVQNGIIRRLVSLSKHNSARVKQSVARALAFLSSTPTNHDEFVGSVLEVLVDLLQCQEGETCRDAAAAIANIATNNEVGTLIGKIGCIHPLMLLLKSPCVLCQINSSHALCRLAMVEENKVSIIIHDGINTLIQLCASKDNDVALLATMVLCNVSTCSIHENGFAREDLIWSLNRAASGDCPISRQHAIMVLCNLASMCRLRDRVALKVCLNQLFGLMKDSTVECRAYTTMLICNLSSVEQHRATILTAGGLSCLENVAVNIDDDINLKRATLLTLYNLSACNEYHAIIERSCLMQFIVAACQSDDWLCQRCALMILSNVACNDETIAVATRGGGLQAAILSLKGDDKALQRFGLVCLANMSNDSQTQSQIVVHGGLQSIINLSRDSNRETRECALMCLSNLCTNETIHLSLVDQAALDVLLDACESVTAASALANLTSSAELIKFIGMGRGVGPLIALANSNDMYDQCLAISALRRLASIAHNRDVMFHQRILSTLANTKNTEHPEIRREIASCLCALSLSSSHRLSMSEISTPALIAFVQSIDSKTVRFSLSAIANVAEDINTHPVLIRANVLEGILHTLSHSETVVKREAAHAVANLLSSKELHPKFIRHGLGSLVQLQNAACEKCDCLAALSFRKLSFTVGSIHPLIDDGLKYILTMIKAKDKITRKHAATALRNLSAMSEEKDLFFKLCIPALIVDVLSNKENDLDVLMAATLRSLSCSKCIIDKFLESGILQCVIQSISKANIDMKSQIAATFGNLSEHLECQTIMIMHGAVKAIDALSAVVDHKDIWKDCARALANLCSAEKKQHVVYRQGGFKTLTTLSHSNCEDCKRYVAISLRFLASNMEVQRALFAEGTFSYYLDMSTSGSLDYQRSAAASFASISKTEEGRFMMKKDGINAILRLCSHTDSHVRKNAVFAIANLAASPENRLHIVIENGLEIIRFASAAARSDVEFLRDTARSLSTLAVDITIKEVMVSQEIPRILSKLAKSADSETQRFASLALCNLCVVTQKQKEFIMKQGVLRVLLFLMRYPDLEVERRACLAVAALSLGSDDNKLVIANNGFVRSLLEVTSYPDIKLRHCALIALNCLALSTEPNTKHLIVEENGLSSLLETLKSCKDDESAHACVYLLGSLAEDADILKAIVEMSFLPLMVQKLEAGSIETKRSVAYMLALLSEYEECHERLKEANVLRSVVALTSLVDEECQYYGAFALSLLAKNKSFQVPLTKMGGVRPLVAIMAKHCQARHWAALALLKLADNFNNHITIAEEGGIHALLQLRGEERVGITVANLAKRAFDDVKQKWKSEV